MNDPAELPKVAFLDTNVLHYIGLYLGYSKKEHFDPLDFEKAADSIHELEDENLKRGLTQGCEVIKLMRERDLQVEYASVAELELLVGRTKGRAVLNAAREGVPDRMFSRIRETQIRQRVNTTQLAEIKAGIDDLADLLEKAGFIVQKSNTERARDVLGLAFEINGLVYIDTMDSIVYSSALLSQADYLFTADRAFQGIVNKIQNPAADTNFEHVNTKLRDLIAAFTLGTASTVELPRVHLFKGDGRISPPMP